MRETHQYIREEVRLPLIRETYQFICEEVRLPLMRETHQYIGEEVKSGLQIFFKIGWPKRPMEQKMVGHFLK